MGVLLIKNRSDYNPITFLNLVQFCFQNFLLKNVLDRSLRPMLPFQEAAIRLSRVLYRLRQSYVTSKDQDLVKKRMNEEREKGLST
jgi:hypothetical protein